MTIFDKDKSKVRMAALTKNGYNDITWFSILDHDHKPVKTIIEGMKRRLENYDKNKITQVLQFYDNQTNQLIDQYEYR